jgi:hypothetical protein
MNAYLASDIRQHVTGDLLTLIATAAAMGAANREFVRGALCLARSSCARYGIDWRGVLADVRADLDGDGMALLDNARLIEG